MGRKVSDMQEDELLKSMDDFGRETAGSLIGVRPPAGRFRVRARNLPGRELRPETALVEGREFDFVPGWPMDEDDPYPGEWAWCPASPDYPEDAPLWIAEGDLEPVKKKTDEDTETVD